ncbi:MAG: hypothetical protein JWQ35_256 [Bacteriovoracaceae bacterium]|nr:hypothetical protein [Bacteriovoracaceae bacterium]
MTDKEKSDVNILLVDDRADSLLALSAVLTTKGYNLVTAVSGYEALERLREREFAVIVLDAQMPGIDGFETAAIIKKDVHLKNIPILFVTAINQDSAYVNKGYSLGAADYIFKPFDPYILKSKVAVFVQLYQQKKRIEQQAFELRDQERRNRDLALADLELDGLRRYKNLADAIPHLILKAKNDGDAHYFNQKWFEYTGLSLELSQGSGWYSAIFVEDLKNIRSFFSESLMKNNSGKNHFEIECRIWKRKDGSYHWHLMRMVPERRKSGEIDGWIGTCTDIHDRKAGETKLIQQSEALARSNADLEQFASIASHDLQEPLRIVTNYTQLIEQCYRDIIDDEGREWIGYTVNASRRMSNLIRDLLSYSKVRDSEFISEIVDSNDILRTVLSNLKQIIEESRATIISEQLPVVRVEKIQLTQLFQNLISNAIKYKSSRIPEIEIKAVRRGGEYIFSVSDNGQGIESKYFSKIFQIFQRLEARDKDPGTGIGLAIAKKIVERHGGRIWVESEFGRGSTFLFSLPLVAQKILQSA